MPGMSNGMMNEFIPERKRRICHNVIGCLAAAQKIHSPFAIATIDQVGRNDVVVMLFQNLADRAITTGRFPDVACKFFKTQYLVNCGRWRWIEIVFYIIVPAVDHAFMFVIKAFLDRE